MKGEPQVLDPVIEEIRSLHHRRVVRLIEVIIVARTPDGRIESHGSTELPGEQAHRLQVALTRSLGFQVGNQDFGENLHWDGLSVLLGVEDVKYIADKLEPGQTAAAVVFEHQWASRLETMIHRRGLRILQDQMITPDALETPGRTRQGPTHN